MKEEKVKNYLKTEGKVMEMEVKFKSKYHILYTFQGNSLQNVS